MEKLIISEDKKKLKKSAPVLIVFGIIAAIAGLCFFIFIAQGALGGAVLGGLGFGGVSAASTGFKRLGLAKNPARTIVCADENGVNVAKDAFTNDMLFFPWEKIQSASAVNKNLLIMLKNPDEYIASLDKKDAGVAKQYLKKFKTPVVIIIETCKEPAGKIAEEINNTLQLVLREKTEV